MAESFKELVARSEERVRQDARRQGLRAQQDRQEQMAQQQHQAELEEVSGLLVRETTAVFHALKDEEIEPDALAVDGYKVSEAKDRIYDASCRIYSAPISTPVFPDRAIERQQRRMDSARDQIIDGLRPFMSYAWDADHSVSWAVGSDQDSGSVVDYGQVLLGTEGHLLLGCDGSFGRFRLVGTSNESVLWSVRNIFEPGNNLRGNITVLKGAREAMANLVVIHGLELAG